MAINVSQAFKRTSIAPIDETLALTKAQMVATVDTLMPAYYFTICQDDGKIYLYDKTATPSVTTGKFTEFSGGGGGGSSDVKFFTTTDTLSKTINGTKVVAAADLPGVTWSDLVVGSSVIKDAKGTMGLVTAITGTTSVTVTTATTSTPTVELTQAQYDALATKDPDTVYFITDSSVAGTYMGAYETIYSTTERVVGSYMGKPLYQKVVTYPITKTGWNAYTHNIQNIETAVKVEGYLVDSGAGIYSTGAASSATAETFLNNAIVSTYATADFNGYTAVATIQYTKTTDTTAPVEYASPNDYSTTEKIVGTWTDGRPIYQKTFTGTTDATGNTDYNDNTNRVTINVGASVNEYVSAEGFIVSPYGTCYLFNHFTSSDVLKEWTKLWLRNNDSSFPNTFVIVTGASSNVAGRPFTVTLRYTKTS